MKRAARKKFNDAKAFLSFQTAPGAHVEDARV
jgi:hypothetical protein